MKILSVFSLVIVFHAVVIGLLLIQPGCQSQPADTPTPTETVAPATTSYTEPSQAQQLDSAFNSGIATSTARPGLSAPTRPEGTSRTTPDTSLLTPVLEPVQEELSLPTIQSE